MDEQRAHRGTIHVEDAVVLGNQAHPGDQYIMRLQAPRVARHARAGSFVHMRCEPAMAMRRPMSIMRADPDAGWIEVLFKAVGVGTRALATQPEGRVLSVMGPIGRPFTPVPDRDIALLLGGGVGIPPMLFLADELARRTAPATPALVVMGSEVPFPFELTRTQQAVPGMPAEVDAALASLTARGVPSRLATKQGYPGCFDGYVTDVAAAYLEACAPDMRRRVAIYACGPTPMLAATARLAARFEVPAQVSLEEFMACAVGGCAGCAVHIEADGVSAMKRVCVDGPVFDAASVVWSSLPD